MKSTQCLQTAFLLLLVTEFATQVKADDPAPTSAQQVRLQEANQIHEQMMELYNAGRAHEGVEPAKRIVAIRREVLGSRHHDTAFAINNLGNMYLGVPDYESARACFEDALDIFKELHGLNDEYTAWAMNSLGYVCRSVGEYEQARQYYLSALDIRREVFGEAHSETATTLNNLGALLQAMGDYAESRTYFEQALEAYQEVDGDESESAAIALNNLGALLNDQGNYAEAVEYFEQALAIRREVLGNEHPDTASTLCNLGSAVHSQGDNLAAVTYYNEALKIRRATLGDRHPDIAIALNNMGGLFRDLDRIESARDCYELALSIRREKLGPRHPDTAQSIGNLGTFLAYLGQYAESIPYYEEALGIRRQVLGNWHPLTASLLERLAASQAGVKRTGAAAQCIDESRHISRRHIKKVLPALSDREQLMFLEANDSWSYEKALSFGWQFDSDPAICELSAAWQINGKALTLESVSERTLLARESSNPQLAETIAALVALRRQIASLSMTAPADGEQAERQEEIDALARQEEALSRRLRQSGSTPVHDEDWIDLSQVRAQLPQGAVFIDIACFDFYDYTAANGESKWGDSRYAAWVIPPAGPVKVVDLGKAEEIDALIVQARTALGAASALQTLIAQQGEPLAERRVRQSLSALSKAVLSPLVAAAGNARQWVISPDANLWLVPFTALPLADNRFAVEQYEFRYVTSGRDLLPRSAGPQLTGPIIMADPNFDLSPKAAEAATRAIFRTAARSLPGATRAISNQSSLLPRVERLPGTATEAQAVLPRLASYARAEPRVYTDRFALESVFKMLHRPKALVVSTHGFFLPEPDDKDPDAATGLAAENPLLRCGLLLAGCNSREKSDDGEDGVLTGLEIVGTDLRGTELVVLSACETGLGRVRNSEGVAGLRQSFQLAGAESIVATLWQIPDRETSQLMSDFFGYLASGQTKPAALRMAQLARIKARRDRSGAAHPYFWAAFTLTGE